MTRTLQRAQYIFDSSVVMLCGDHRISEYLEGSLEGCYGVNNNLPSEIDRQLAEKFAKAASRKWKKRIWCISETSAAEETRWIPMADQKRNSA